jgi:hypothetical protein
MLYAAVGWHAINHGTTRCPRGLPGRLMPSAAVRSHPSMEAQAVSPSSRALTIGALVFTFVMKSDLLPRLNIPAYEVNYK